MKKKGRNIDLLKRVWIISVVLILSLAIIPMPNGVVSGTITVSMELEAGWNLKGMPKSMTASDLALKSSYITNIVHRTSDGYYVSYIPSLGITDFNLEVNEGVFIYSETDTTITFIISPSSGYMGGNLIVTGDLNVTGDCVFDKNLTVLGSLSIAGNFVANSLNVTEDLTVDGDLTVNENLGVGEDLTVNGNLMVTNDLTVGNMIITEDMTINNDLSVSGDAMIDGDSIVTGDMQVLGNLTAGDFTVDNLTISDDLSINGNLSVEGYATIGEDLTVSGDAVIAGNLTVGDFTVGNLTISEDLSVGKDLSVSGSTFIDGDLTVNGTFSVENDVQVDGNLSVIQDTTIGGYLTVTGNGTFENDLTVNGNLTVYNLVSNIVSENYVVENLTVTGNVTGLAFSETADYLVFIDSGVVYAKNGATGNIDFQSTDASYVIQSTMDALYATGGKIFIKGGTYNCPSALSIENRGDPTETITIEGEGYIRTTTLKLMSPTIIPTFLSLKGSRFLQFRNLHFEVNKKANYGIRMERDSSGAGAGDHILENVFVSNAVQVGILIYASENNFLNNVWVRYGNPIGMLITSVPPVADPTVKGAIAVNTSGAHYSSGGTVMNYCKWGEPSTTTKAGLIIYRSQVSAFGGLCMVRQDAEAAIIIDETQNQCIFDGVWIDQGPDTAIKIGQYPSPAKVYSQVTFTGMTVRQMAGDKIIEADRMSGSVIMGIVTSRTTGKIILNTTTENNFVSGFTRVTGATGGEKYLTVEDYGIGNSIYQATVTIGNDLLVDGNLTIAGDLSVAGDSTFGGDSAVAGDMVIDGNLTVNGTFAVDKDVQINGNLSVIQDTTIGGHLTVTGNGTFEQDLTVNGNLTVYNLVTDIVSENYVVGNLTVTENATGLPFTEETDYTIFIDSGVIYAKNGNTGEIEFQSTDASLVFNPVIQNVISRGYGGKIFFKPGRYNFSEALIIEGVTEAEGTITIEGSGYWRATKLYLMSPTILPTFISLKGSRCMQLRNLQLEVNNKANYGIRMERDATGHPAGDHVLENVWITNARQVGLLSYGSENLHLENVYSRYGNPIGMMITGFPPVADPTVIGAMPVNLSGTPRSTLQITMINCKWGEAGTTTRAGLIIYRAQVSILGGLSMIRQDAEANFIIDENLNHGLISGAIIDIGPACGFKIGAYPSAGHYNSHLTIQGVNARVMNGTNIVHAQYMVGSSIMGLMTNQDDGKIILEATTARNFISGFINYSITSEYLQVIDNGVGNIVLQDIIYMNSTVSVGHNLRVVGDISVIGDLSVGGDISYDNLELTGDLTVWGNITGATGRTDTLVVAAGDSSALSKAQADYLCDGINDNVEIQAAIDAVNALGVHGTVKLLEGTYSCTSKINGKSNVDLIGPATIIVASDSNIHGVELDDVTNADWKDITVIRTGNPSGIVHAGYIIGTTDDSCRIIDCVFDNQATAGSASTGLQIGEVASPYCDNVKGYGAAVSTHSYGIAIYNAASPTLYNCYGEAYSIANNGYGIYLYCVDGSPKLYNCKGVSTLAIGIFTIYCVDYETELHNCEGIGLYGIQIASESSPTLIGCIGRGNSQDGSYGYAITDQAEPVLEGCVGYGGTGINGHGFYLPDSVTPTMMNCVGYAGDGTGSIGIYMLTSASPTIIGGKFVAGNVSSSKAVKLSQTASPKITNTVFTNHETSHSWEYDDADSGRFRPYGGANYQLITISIHVQVENVGVTVDLGTTPGGNQIADDIDIGSYGGTSVNYVRVSRSSDAYMYATVSSPVGDGDFVVYYAVMNDNSGWTADLETAGYPQFTDCQFYAGVYGLPMYIQGVSVTYPNFRFTNCLFENYDTAYGAISASGEIDATGHFIDCVFRGTITNIINLFETEVEYFHDVQAGSQDYVVSNEDLTGFTPITCSISNQPDVPRNINFTIIDLDTSITAFTIYVNGIDARGNTVSESFTFLGGLIQTGNIAFATISSIQVSDITGAGLGDVLNVGIGTKLGLSNSIQDFDDVYKIKKNSADYPSTSYTVDPTYDTVDVSNGGSIIAGDDFTIWYKYY